MIKKRFIIILLAALALMGCKKQDWLDWKAQNDIWFASQKTYTYHDPVNGDSIFPLQTTDLGVKYCVLSDPNKTEARPSAESYITVTYTGTLINGAVFDSGTGTLSMGSVVSGFADGMKHIHTNGDIVFYVPYKEGYGVEAQGTEGTSSYIPPYSVLIFKVHLIEIQ